MSLERAITILTTDDQLREAIAVHRAVHGEPEPIFEEFLYCHPRWGAPGAHRAVVDGDRIVALTSVAMWRQRFGASALPAAEIGLVGTLPDHRNRGHSRALMESWLETMRAEAIPLSFLIGIPGYYERWSYHYAAPNHANNFLSIGREALASCAAADTKIRAADPERDVVAIRDLIAADMRRTSGSPVLDDTLLRYFIDRADVHGVNWWAVEDESGAVSGVARMKRWEGGTGPQAAGAVTIAATRDNDACAAIATAMLNHLDHGGTEELPLAIAPHGPFARWLYHRGASRRSDRSVYPGGYASMYRVNDLRVVLEALCGTWDEPASVSRFASTAITLRVGQDGAQIATVEVTPGGVAIHAGSGGIEIGAPPAVTVPWITGWRSAADWLDGTSFPPLPGPRFDPGDPGALPRGVRDLLRALFPVRHPYIADTIQGS